MSTVIMPNDQNAALESMQMALDMAKTEGQPVALLVPPKVRAYPKKTQVKAQESLEAFCHRSCLIHPCTNLWPAGPLPSTHSLLDVHAGEEGTA